MLFSIFRFFVNLGFTSGSFVGAVAGFFALTGKFGLLTNILLIVAPATLLISLFGLLTGIRYAIGIATAFVIASAITSGQIFASLLIGAIIGICSFAVIALVELIEAGLSRLSESARTWENF